MDILIDTNVLVLTSLFFFLTGVVTALVIEYIYNKFNKTKFIELITYMITKLKRTKIEK